MWVCVFAVYYEPGERSSSCWLAISAGRRCIIAHLISHCCRTRSQLPVLIAVTHTDTHLSRFNSPSVFFYNYRLPDRQCWIFGTVSVETVSTRTLSQHWFMTVMSQRPWGRMFWRCSFNVANIYLNNLQLCSVHKGEMEYGFPTEIRPLIWHPFQSLYLSYYLQKAHSSICFYPSQKKRFEDYSYRTKC